MWHYLDKLVHVSVPLCDCLRKKCQQLVLVVSHCHIQVTLYDECYVYKSGTSTKKLSVP